MSLIMVFATCLWVYIKLRNLFVFIPSALVEDWTKISKWYITNFLLKKKIVSFAIFLSDVMEFLSKIMQLRKKILRVIMLDIILWTSGCNLWLFTTKLSLSLSLKPSTTLSYPYNFLLWGPTIVNGQQPFFWGRWLANNLTINSFIFCTLKLNQYLV